MTTVVPRDLNALLTNALRFATLILSHHMATMLKVVHGKNIVMMTTMSAAQNVKKTKIVGKATNVLKGNAGGHVVHTDQNHVLKASTVTSKIFNIFPQFTAVIS